MLSNPYTESHHFWGLGEGLARSRKSNASGLALIANIARFSSLHQGYIEYLCVSLGIQ